MAATIWEPSSTINTTLSGGNLVATSTGVGGVRTSRAMMNLVYFEGTITTLTGAPAIGIANSNWNRSTALGTGADTIGYLPSGLVKNNAATLATLAAYVQGNAIGVAVDVLNRLIWFRVNGGNWNNAVGNDPATGVGGIDFSGIAIETIFAAVSASLTGNVWTMVFSTPFGTAAPTGYGSMDTATFAAAKSTTEPSIPTGATPAAGIVANPNNDQTTHGKQFSPGGAIQTVSGLVEEFGVAVQGRRVDVYDRVTGDLIGTTTSAVDGTWSITCVGRTSVRVVCSDPFTFDSMVYDNVVPM